MADEEEAEDAVEDDEEDAAAAELDGLDEQPATTSADKATAPKMPASRRTRVRRSELRRHRSVVQLASR